MESGHDTIFEVAEKPKSKNATILLVGIICYIIIITFDFINGFSEQGIPTEAYLLYSIFIIIPVIGSSLLQFKKKAGWIICLFYFEFLAFAQTSSFVRTSLRAQKLSVDIFPPMRTSAMYMLSVMVTTLLFTKDLRQYLKVRPKMLWVTLILISIINALTLYLSFRR